MKAVRALQQLHGALGKPSAKESSSCAKVTWNAYGSRGLDRRPSVDPLDRGMPIQTNIVVRKSGQLPMSLTTLIHTAELLGHRDVRCFGPSQAADILLQ